MPDDSRRRRWLRAGLKRATARLAGRDAAPTGPVSLCFDGRAPVEVERGITVLAAAVLHGVDISHYCGGMASCGTCKVEVVAGAENLAAADGREQMVLGSQSTADGHRLACQARVMGPVTVRIPRWF